MYNAQLKIIRLSKILLSASLISVVFACVEPYNFIVENDQASLVVEGYISDASFNKTLAYPSDGKYAAIKLSYTSDVINIKSEPVIGAQVSLSDDLGQKWNYTEVSGESPLYLLLETDFAAKRGRSYQLQIILKEGDEFKSEWVQLPAIAPVEIGEITFVETQRETYVYRLGKREIQTVNGINTNISVPKNSRSESIYLKWTYEPTWEFRTPLPNSDPSIPETCWVTNTNYLNGFHLKEDNTGGYSEELFFMETTSNSRIYEMMSVLFTQQIMNKEFFFFWKELKEQAQGGLLFDRLPFNLPSNIKGTNTDIMVSGYFDAVIENATRWYFCKEDLSYFVSNNLTSNCLSSIGPPGPPAYCVSCLNNNSGHAKAEQPTWWIR